VPELTRAAPTPEPILARATRTPPASPTARAENVQDLMRRCPTADEVAAIDRDLQLHFEVDPFNGQLVCRASQGSVDLTTLQLRAYQALLAMRRMRFDAPLPWTSLSLYDWFNQAIDAVRFRGDIEYSYCCDPARTINIDAPHLTALETDQWLDPQQGEGIQGLMVLLVHEARHSEGYWHTCGSLNTTIDEMGAFGMQYWTYMWLAYHSDPAFLTPGEAQPGLYREMSRDLALGFRAARDQGAGPFCKEATLTPGPTPTVW
jgi:hypothetical protein